VDAEDGISSLPGQVLYTPLQATLLSSASSHYSKKATESEIPESSQSSPHNQLYIGRVEASQHCKAGWFD